jgi:N-acetylmuramoyl-L-alanine amidase
MAILILLMLTPLALFANEPVYLSGLLVRSTPTVSRFTFILSEKTYGHLKYNPHPDRVEIEFSQTVLQFNMHPTSLSGSNVKSFNVNELKNGSLRFVFYVTGYVEAKTQFLPATGEEGVRLELILTTKQAKPVKPVSERWSDAKKTLKTSTTPLITATYSGLNQKMSQQKLQQIFKDGMSKTFEIFTAELKDRQSSKNTIKKPAQQLAQNKTGLVRENKMPAYKAAHSFVVVIDAGHGGKDPGALGVNGIQEKQVVLQIAKALANEINAKPGMRAVLTREGDRFVPLRGRLKLARKGKADIFIAVHADAYYEKDATGASVFALSARGASSEAARWLAQHDNYSELGGVSLGALVDRDPMLRSVLLDLAQTVTMQDSVLLGNKLLDALDPITSLHALRVERAPFVVLKSPDIPSVLVETGFLTNPKEAKRLTDPLYQKKLAKALARGVENYLLASSVASYG